MDVLEKDKLRWMENIPHKVETKTQGNGPRFDFEGRIIDEDVSTIPQHVGLHHHKSQPQLPGYNFNELFELARSQVTQQRVLSIKVLGRILYKDKHGEYIAQGCSPFTPTLLDAGLPFILRWFLDERSQSSMQASIETLWSLLAPTSSEKTYSNVMMSCCRGYETNCLRSNFEVPKKSDTDCDVIKRDLILGFLQMDLLPRLRYTLEVCAPDTSTINKCLECIERISQHSAQSSLKVLECPRLLRVIAEKFVSVVTCNTTQADDFAVSSSVCAVRLFQTICQSSWENAHKLVTENVEMVELMQWFVVAVGGVGCEGSKSLNLLKLEREMWNLWRIASTYGLMLDIFMKFPEVLMQQLQTCIQIINNKSSSIDQLKWCQGVVLMFGAAVTNLPSIHGRNTLGLLNRFFPLMKTVATSAVSVATSIPDNNLKNVMRHHGIVASSLALLSDWLKYFNENSEISSEIKNEIVPNIILPLRRIVLREYQTCYKPPETSPTIEISSLPNLGLNFRNEEYLLKFISSHNLLESYMKVVYDVTRLTGPCESIVELMLNLVDVDLNKINQHFQPCIYFRILPRIFYWIIKSCLLLLPHHRQLGMKYLSIHKISMFAFNSLFPGDEYYARDLLLHALFNPTLISDMKVLLSETFSESQILTMMSSIHHTYVSSLTIDPKSLAQSKAWCCQNTKEIKSLFLPYDLSTILPVDWPFIPLLQFYDLAIRRSDEENALNAPIVLSSIIDCLRFIYFLEKLRPDGSCKISVTCKITRLMCVFMSGNDIFLDDHVQKLLHKLLVLFLDGKSKSQLNFNKPIPGITSFYDFYVSLLEQFDAVSFGSKIFSMFLLLPLVGDCDVELKLALWSQHTEVVSSIHVDIDELPVAEDLYFSPIETNPQVLMSYLQALVHGKCQPVRTPFMYRLAIHHLSSYLAMEEETKARHEILKKVSLLPTSKMKHAILHNVDSETKTIS
nr:RNA polymerase II-associated protein 1-like [Ciona intestinalis]|eukprot:XP_002124620.1 RNA polymerase II-associated protein 1-like [Ciona intestinalis]